MSNGSKNYGLQTPAEGSVVDEIHAHTYKFRSWIAAIFSVIIILYFIGFFVWKPLAGPNQIDAINQVLDDSTKLLGPILGYCIAFITKNDT